MWNFFNRSYTDPSPESFHYSLTPLFYALVSGASSIVHKDPYQVHILNVKGHVVYRLNGAIYKMEPGDLLTIPENTTHQAIGLSPRIILSYAFY